MLNNKANFCLNSTTLLKAIESSNMHSRNTLAKIMCV